MLRVVLTILLLGTAARADDDPPPQEITPDEPAPKPTPTPAPPPAPVPTPPPPRRVTTMEELTVPKSFLRFGINLFGDAAAFVTSPDKPHTGFAIGTVDLRLLGELGHSLDAIAEIGFELSDSVPVADVEQLAIRWRGGPGTLQVGRFHTDLGYWNTAYHHGLWLQTPIERPHIVRFEDDDGLLPVHWVGLEYALTTKLGSGKAGLVLGVANGRGDVVDQVLVGKDTNEAKAIHVAARLKWEQFQLGAGAIVDTIAPAPATIRPALPDTEIVELIGSAHLVIRGAGPLVIAEGHVIHHRADGSRTTTIGAYALAGYAVTPWLMPYAAFDLVDGADDDPYFNPDPMAPLQHDRVEGLAGLRFETSLWSALKLEFQYEQIRAGGDRSYKGIASWSFGL